MADIELVVKVDENIYRRFINGFTDEVDATLIEELFKNATPLPKGHGRLKDENKILGKLTYIDGGINMDIFTNEVRGIINDAPTIIEANEGDKE